MGPAGTVSTGSPSAKTARMTELMSSPTPQIAVHACHPDQQPVALCRRWGVEDATGPPRANGPDSSEDGNDECHGPADLESVGQRSRRLWRPVEPYSGEEAKDQRSEPTVSPRRNAGRAPCGRRDVIMRHLGCRSDGGVRHGRGSDPASHLTMPTLWRCP